MGQGGEVDKGHSSRGHVYGPTWGWGGCIYEECESCVLNKRRFPSYLRILYCYLSQLRDECQYINI